MINVNRNLPIVREIDRSSRATITAGTVFAYIKIQYGASGKYVTRLHEISMTFDLTLPWKCPEAEEKLPFLMAGMIVSLMLYIIMTLLAHKLRFSGACKKSFSTSGRPHVRYQQWRPIR